MLNFIFERGFIMKLSMWMIANRLHNVDLDLSHISDHAPMNLKSARRTYATNCVHVYQDGNDSVCKNEEDYFVIKNLEASTAVEIVQSVFDYYNDWDAFIRESAENGDFQMVVHKSWHIFHNPIVLMDSNWNVLALSNQYDENSVDSEWLYLKKYGACSPSIYDYFQKDLTNNFISTTAQYYHVNNPKITDCISSLIVYQNNICGRINVLEKDRPLNRGDMQVIDYLTKTIALAMNVHGNKKNKNYHSVYHELLLGHYVNDDRLRSWLDYKSWSPTENFYLYVLSTTIQEGDPRFFTLTRNQLSRLLTKCEFTVVDNNLVMIVRKEDHAKNLVSTLLDFNKDSHFVIGKSLLFHDIRQCKYFYDQVLFALKHKKQDDESIIDFYNYAIEFLIRKNTPNLLIKACHPDIVSLWEQDKDRSLERLKTFKVYLNNERSLLNSAQELFIHRNTMVYRINKILDSLTTGDLEDVYTRDYMKLSIRVLEIFAKEL